MKQFAFQPVKPRRLTDVVQRQLGEYILSGKVGPGDRLPSEPELAHQFGVSAIVVKQAVAGLAALGLVRKKQGKGGGLFIGEPERQPLKTLLKGYLTSQKFTLAHLQELRGMVEPEMARLACRGINSVLIQALEKNVAECRRLDRALRRKASLDQYLVMQDRIGEFHRLLAEATGNPLLVLVIEYISDMLRTISITIYKGYPAGFGDRVIGEHTTILEAIRLKDADLAERRMRAHIGWAGRELVEAEARDKSRHLPLRAETDASSGNKPQAIKPKGRKPA
jgi:GntR family transcriptional repressor for pyruvate dehydrogenase complex